MNALHRISAVAMFVVAALLVGCGASGTYIDDVYFEGDVHEEVVPPSDLDTVDQGLGTAIYPNSTNFTILKGACYYGEWLKWSGCTSNNGNQLTATYKSPISVGGTTGVHICDPWNTYCGECVSLIKSLSGRTAPTYQWAPGTRVNTGIVGQGVAIATFPNGTYSGHVAFLRSYIKDSAGNITGMRVWDSNWGGIKAIRSHTIGRSGTGYNNLDNYYVVLAP